MKNGIFVGSFNPPTKAHFDIAHYLYDNNVLEKIIFVPVNNEKKDLISLEKRIDMLNSYIKKYDYLYVSKIMQNYQGFNYQVLNELSNIYEDIYIIMGSDLLERFSSFVNYQDMLEKYHFIIIPRFGIDSPPLIEKEYHDYQDKFIVMDYHSNISSSLVRESYKANKDIKDMVPSEVEEYIRCEMLYQWCSIFLLLKLFL